MSTEGLSFERYHGAAIGAVVEPLGMLRIEVFREWPYLYEGSLAYEKDYLGTYVGSERSLLYAVWQGEEMVGATTCIPLSDETAEVQAPFLAAGMDVGDIFYFGESILRGSLRGHGLGNRFFDEREAHARSWGSYGHACFCGVVRPDDHHMRPADYQPLDGFWAKRGYVRQAGLQSFFTWKDIGCKDADAKQMVYWMRKL